MAIEAGSVKALTLTQPWATAVALGLKRIETRSWSTSYRGLLAVHAAKGMDYEARFFCIADYIPDLLQRKHVPNPLRAKGYETFRDYPRGAVVAICRLANCVPTTYPGMAQDIEQWGGGAEAALGDYSSGRFAWLLADIKPLDEPIPAKGSLGVWEWPVSVEQIPGSTALAIGRKAMALSPLWSRREGLKRC